MNDKMQQIAGATPRQRASRDGLALPATSRLDVAPRACKRSPSSQAKVSNLEAAALGQTTAASSIKSHEVSRPTVRRCVEKLAPSERVVWDHVVPGLGRRLRVGCRSVWIMQRRINGRTVRRTLSAGKEVEVEEARGWAEAFLSGSVTTSIPPYAGGITLRQFVDVFLRDCSGRWKPTTLAVHKTGLKFRVVPVLGDKKLAAIARADVVSWFQSKHGGCNRALSVLSSLMLHAESVGLRPVGSNPCAGLRRKRTEFTAQYPLSSDFRDIETELKRYDGTRQAEANLLRFLMLTGARRGEAIALRWDHINGARAILPDSKTGEKTIWLPPVVQSILARTPKSYLCPYVFGGNDRAAQIRRLVALWKVVRSRLRLRTLRIHDLRHGYASVGVTQGEDLRTIGALLGHVDYTTTLGYAHLAERPVAEAAGRVSKGLAAALTGVSR